MGGSYLRCVCTWSRATPALYCEIAWEWTKSIRCKKTFLYYSSKAGPSRERGGQASIQQPPETRSEVAEPFLLAWPRVLSAQILLEVSPPHPWPVATCEWPLNRLHWGPGGGGKARGLLGCEAQACRPSLPAVKWVELRGTLNASEWAYGLGRTSDRRCSGTGRGFIAAKARLLPGNQLAENAHLILSFMSGPANATKSWRPFQVPIPPSNHSPTLHCNMGPVSIFHTYVLHKACLLRRKSHLKCKCHRI